MFAHQKMAHLILWLQYTPFLPMNITAVGAPVGHVSAWLPLLRPSRQIWLPYQPPRSGLYSSVGEVVKWHESSIKAAQGCGYPKQAGAIPQGAGG